MRFIVRHRVLLIALAALIVLFGALGYGFGPGLVRGVIEQQLAQKLGRHMSVAEVAVHPYRLGVTLTGLRIDEADAATPMLEIGSVDVGVSPASLLRAAPVVNHITVTQPTLHLVRLAPQRFNFSDILDRLDAAPKSSGRAQFSINNVTLTQGTITFDDRVTQSQHKVEELNVTLPSISNIRHDVDHDVDPALSARIDGSPLVLKGRSKPFATSLDTAITLEIQDFDVPRYLGFVPVTLKPRITSGTLSGTIELAFSRDASAVQQFGVAGHLVLEQLKVQHPDGQPAISVGRIALSIKNLDPVARRVQLDALEINAPEVFVERAHDGRIDLAELFASDESGAVNRSGVKARAVERVGASANPGEARTDAAALERTAETSPAQAPAVELALGSLRVTEGTLHYRDQTLAQPFSTTLSGIDVAIQGLSTAAGSRAHLKAQVSLADRQTLGVEGEMELANRSADLQITTQDVALAPYTVFAGGALHARIEGGIANIATHVSASITDSVPSLQLSGLSGSLAHLRVLVPGQPKAALVLDRLSVDGGSFDLRARSLKLAKVEVKGLDADVVRDAAGQLNVAAIYGDGPRPQPALAAPVESVTETQAPEHDSRAAAAPQHAADFQVAIDDFEFDEGRVHYRDAGLPDKTAVALEKISLSARQVRLGNGARIPFKFSAVANGRGRVDVSGDLSPSPLSVTARVTARRLPLAALQAYAPQRLNITIVNADLTLHGELKFAAQPGTLHFAGGLGVSDFSALDRVTGADFLSWKTLDVSSLEIDSAGAARAPVVQVGDVVFADFYSRVIIYPDGRLNLQDIAASEATAAPQSLTTPGAEPEPARGPDTPASAPAQDGASRSSAPASTATPAEVTHTAHTATAQLAPAATPAASGPAAIIRLKSVTVRNGSMNYTDNFVRPNYTTAISDLKGSVSAMASDAPQPADVTLHGSLEGNGDLSVSGKINPLAKPLFLDLAASATNIELTRLSAYSIKYAGYNIEKGKLSMKVQYHIEKGQLKAENHLFLDQLTFGEHVENATATKLPVLLAVSLLKNRRGEIDVDLPISGSLSDPQFSIGGVIVRVILNLLEKALLSPFSLLTSLAGPGGEDLGHVQFAAGEATLSAAESAKIDHLAGVLADRPALKLDIIGRADRNTDAEQARQARLAARVKGEKFREVLRSDDTASFEAVVVSPEEYPHYLEALYKDMDFEKPKNAIGLTKGLPVAEMERLIRENMPVNDDDLEALAYRRAAVVRAALEKSGKVPADRIFLVAPKLGSGGDTDKVAPSRVDFALH